MMAILMHHQQALLLPASILIVQEAGELLKMMIFLLKMLQGFANVVDLSP
jgi:hypothetical protein